MEIVTLTLLYVFCESWLHSQSQHSHLRLSVYRPPFSQPGKTHLSFFWRDHRTFKNGPQISLHPTHGPPVTNVLKLGLKPVQVYDHGSWSAWISVLPNPNMNPFGQSCSPNNYSSKLVQEKSQQISLICTNVPRKKNNGTGSSGFEQSKRNGSPPNSTPPGPPQRCTAGTPRSFQRCQKRRRQVPGAIYLATGYYIIYHVTN